MKSNILTLLIKEVDQPIKEIAITNTLESYYNAIDCDLIEFYYPFEERPDLCCIIDEEGRLKRRLISWRVPKSNMGLNGTILFAKDDGMGNTISLNREDIEFIKSRCQFSHYATFERDFDCNYTIMGW